MEREKAKNISPRSRKNKAFRWVLTVLGVLLIFCEANLSKAEDSSGLEGSINNQVINVTELVQAIDNGSEGDTIVLAPGIYVIDKPLLPKADMTIIGADPEHTIISPAPDWIPDFARLPNKEDPEAYLFKIMKVNNVTISNITLIGPSLYGAVYADNADGLELSGLHLKDFQWSSIRTFRMNNFRVHDNVFVDAGGKHGHTGGALYLSYTTNSEFWNNKIVKSEGMERNFFGFKGRKATNVRFHHNDVRVSFSLEFPFENDEEVEIDHNRFDGVISIPKFAGGPVLEDKLSFHIHHNWLRRSYALEWARNSVEVDYNLFDFDPADDGGNLISNFGSEPAEGPTYFHDNLIKNPGRGLFWSQGVYNRFFFYNNSVKANTEIRQNGLFKINQNSTAIVIRDNIIENTLANPRPLLENPTHNRVVVENNTLSNITDSEAYANLDTGAMRGPIESLFFKVGVNDEYTVDGWEAQISPS